MDKISASLRVKKFKGKDDEDFSMRSVGIITISEGKGLDVFVAGFERDPSNDDGKGPAIYK